MCVHTLWKLLGWYCVIQGSVCIDKIMGYVLLLLPLGDGIPYRHLEFKKESEIVLSDKILSPEPFPFSS
jgi:hypothetical protein